MNAELKELCRYKLTRRKGDFFTAVVNYLYAHDGERGCSYVYRDKYDIWEVKTDIAGMPDFIHHVRIDGSVDLAFAFDGKGTVRMTGIFQGEQTERREVFAQNVTLENMLMLKCMDLTLNKKFSFDIIQSTEYPNLAAYPMYFLPIAEEKITIAAGEYECVKVLFSVSDVRGKLYKAFYFVTKEFPRTIVKCVNVPAGSRFELISRELA